MKTSIYLVWSGVSESNRLKPTWKDGVQPMYQHRMKRMWTTAVPLPWNVHDHFSGRIFYWYFHSHDGDSRELNADYMKHMRTIFMPFGPPIVPINRAVFLTPRQTTKCSVLSASTGELTICKVTNTSRIVRGFHSAKVENVSIRSHNHSSWKRIWMR